MTIESIIKWLNSPFALILIIISSLILILIFIALYKIKRSISNNQDYYIQLQNKVDSDNMILKNLLGNISSSFEIRVNHLEKLSQQQHRQFRQEAEITKETLGDNLNNLRESLYKQQAQIQEGHNHSFLNLQKLISEQLKTQTEHVRQNLNSLNETTESKLREISEQVNKQLEKGLQKTQTTFIDIQKRLSIIDEAQKRIDSLSSNVVSLQNVLTDKKSRGAFGEIQLQTIVENALPNQFISFQHTLSNNKRADCVIHLPKPNGDIVIDAKFPLESYRQLIDGSNVNDKNTKIAQIFKKDIKKHITDISEKYIIPPETAESAILFIPAEAIFSEIQANHSDLVEFSQKNRVWLSSPTTLMAILATAKSVIKDEATRQQAHIMREQLHKLHSDFGRFQTRMNNLAKHINLASKDVDEVNTSANKISNHFHKIEASDEWSMLSDIQSDKE